MTTRRLGRCTASAICAILLFLASTPNRAADPTPSLKWETSRTTLPEDIEELRALQERVRTVVEKCTPATVALRVRLGGFGEAAGSGVIVSEDGLVLTAAHVIAGEGGGKTYTAGRDVIIVLADGKTAKGKTLGINEKMDSGMVKITDKGPNNGKWPFAPIARSADVKKGQWVVSLGHPGGPKTGRPPVARLGRVENTTRDLIRSNCTLVGGDSGGPLFDLDGQVIGIHSRIGLTLNQNIHVPTDQYKNDWDALVAGEVVGRPQKTSGAVVGVVFSDDENDDAWLVEVDADGPAGKAGLQPGDTITKFDDQVIKSVKQFRDILKDKKPAEVVKLTVRRGTKVFTVPVTLGRRGG
jgi:serine protease Do